MNEEMELNLNQLQEQCLLAKEMLVSIQARMEQQNPFDFLKVRLHINIIMGTLAGEEGWKDVEAALPIGKGEETYFSAFKTLWEKSRRLLLPYSQ